MHRVVLDSSVLLSAFLTPQGTSAEVLLAARRGAFTLCLSQEILAETGGKLREKAGRLQRRYPYDPADVAAFIAMLTVTAELAGELPELRVVPLDPKDDMIVATAVAADAGYLVTGDRHLLTLDEHEGIRMVTPRQFLDLLD